MFVVLSTVLLLGTSPLGTSPAPTRVLSVDDALRLALANSPRIQAAQAQSRAANDAANSLRGRMLPGIYVAEEYQRYDEPFAVSYFAAGAPAGTPAPSLVVRERDTNTFVVSARQPLVGLLHLQRDHAALSSAAEASYASLAAVDTDIREEVQRQFRQLFEARAMVEVAGVSKKQLSEQLEVARAKLKAGVLTNADVLRLQVAVANAQQQEIQAGAQEEVARAALVSAIGLAPDDTSVDFAEPTLLEEASEPPQLSAAILQAEQNRPEVRAASLTAQSADQHASARLFDMLPEVSAEAVYTHITGQVFAPADQRFVGVVADWPVWEWGARWYQRQQAVAQADAADANCEHLRRRVALEVTGRLAQLRAAANAVTVSQTAIASAQEAFRVTTALVDAGSATTTDLLDAQSALSQAKLNLVRSRYARALATVALRRALGAL